MRNPVVAPDTTLGCSEETFGVAAQRRACVMLERASYGKGVPGYAGTILAYAPFSSCPGTSRVSAERTLGIG